MKVISKNWKWLVALLLVVVVGVVLWKVKYQPQEKKEAPKATSTIEAEPESTQISGWDVNPEFTVAILKSHAPIVEKLMEGLEGEKRVSRYMDLFSPLGVLDINADENGNGKVLPKVENIEFGYFFNMTKYTDEELEKVATSPLSFASTKFNQKDYFLINKEDLITLRETTAGMQSLKVIGLWSSGLRRINDVFIDYEKKLIWKLPRKGVSYDFDTITMHSALDITANNPDMAELQGIDLNKITLLFDTMQSLSVSTIYKCKDVTIFILGGVINNAFGFVYNAKSASEVNCGLLENKFEIVKDEAMDTEWRYWIGR